MNDSSVKAIVVEPVNSATGLSASDGFIDSLSSIARSSGAALIVDETNSCAGASGKGFFAYQGSGADYVTFGDRTVATGYFSRHSGNHFAPTMFLGGSALDVDQFAVICE